MDKISLAISNPDSTAFSLYATGIISRPKRDEISDCEQTSKKKIMLLRAVEDKIDLNPEVYHQFVEILSQDMSMEFICGKMREQCRKIYMFVRKAFHVLCIHYIGGKIGSIQLLLYTHTTCKHRTEF